MEGEIDWQKNVRERAFRTVTPEREKEVMSLIKAQPDVTVIESQEPEATFVGKEDYSPFSELPAAVQNELRNLSLNAEKYLRGFEMVDNRTKEERDNWERDVQQTEIGEDFSVVYRWSKLRLTAMSHLLRSLLNATHFIRQRRIDSPQAEALFALQRRIPPSVVPQPQTGVYYPELGTTVVEPPSLYTLLNLEDKRKVVKVMESIAREYLSMVRVPDTDGKSSKGEIGQT